MKIMLPLLLIATNTLATPILIGERKTSTLQIIDENLNTIWKMKLKGFYGSASINDAKRVTYKERLHIAVTGNTPNRAALVDFERKRIIFATQTGKHPHDIDLVENHLAVANSRPGSIELYPLDGSTMTSISHPGVHAVQYDHKKRLLWAWGARSKALRSYKLIRGRLALHKKYPTTFEVGVGHGAAPMVIGDKRYLLLAAKSGILRFDTDTEEFNMIQETESLYRGVKGISYSQETGEIIFTKNWAKIMSLHEPTRYLPGTKIYKARFWQERFF